MPGVEAGADFIPQGGGSSGVMSFPLATSLRLYSKTCAANRFI